MKNINKYIWASALAMGTMLTACEDEVLVPVEDNTAATALLTSISEQDALLTEYNLENNTVTLTNARLRETLDSLNDARNDLNWGESRDQTEVQYTVNVISAANYLTGRVAGVNGATVTVTQGSYSETKETSSGLAVFSGLQHGEAIVNISAPDHTSAEMVVEFYSDYSSDADYTNASTIVPLYPVSGENAAVLTGRVMANTTTVNDTLARTYGDDVAIYGDKAGTYISNPGIYSGTNYTDEWGGNDMTPYGATLGAAVAFEAVPAAFRLFAVAKPNVSEFSSGEAGYIVSITYSGLISEASIAADGTYTLTVPASKGGSLALSYETTEVIAPFTEFTNPGNNGATDYTFKYFNNGNGNATVWTEEGDGSNVIIAPNTSMNIVRSIRTRNYEYEIFENSFLQGSVKPGEKVINDFYLWPTYPGEESGI